MSSKLSGRLGDCQSSIIIQSVEIITQHMLYSLCKEQQLRLYICFGCTLCIITTRETCIQFCKFCTCSCSKISFTECYFDSAKVKIGFMSVANDAAILMWRWRMCRNKVSETVAMSICIVFWIPRVSFRCCVWSIEWRRSGRWNRSVGLSDERKDWLWVLYGVSRLWQTRLSVP